LEKDDQVLRQNNQEKIFVQIVEDKIIEEHEIKAI